MDVAALEETRRRFEPRRLVAYARWGVSPPSWCDERDKLHLTYVHQERLFLRGQVVWAVFVQANAALWEPGDDDHPAMTLYGLDPALDHELPLLRTVARRIYALKGSAPDEPDAARQAAIVTDERARALHTPVGRSLTEGRALWTTTTQVHRDHLPQGWLREDALPLLVDPETRASLVLPAEYWAEPILAAWGVDLRGASQVPAHGS